MKRFNCRCWKINVKPFSWVYGNGCGETEKEEKEEEKKEEE